MGLRNIDEQRVDTSDPEDHIGEYGEEDAYEYGDDRAPEQAQSEQQE